MSSPAALPSCASTARIALVTSFAVDLAADEVVRLDAGRPFVDAGDARVAQVLRRSGLLDEAHPAVDLDAGRGDVDPRLGAPALDDGDRKVDERLVAGALFLVGMAMPLVHRRCDPIG